MLAWTGAECLGALRLSTRTGLTAAVLLLVLCAALTRAQLRFWLNTETLFTHAIAVTQDNWLAHYNLGLLALRRYQDTQRGPVEKQVLELESARRSPVESGSASRDYLAEIIFHCQATLRSKPGFPDPRITLAKALTEQGRLDEARAQLEMAIPLDPKSAEARQNLAEILHRQGRVAEAITEYKAALKLRPDWDQVLNNLAWLLATYPSPNIRNGLEAAGFAERACALTSRTNLWFLHTLAAAYAERGNFAQAVAATEEARRLAADSGRTELANLAETRLALYKTRQPLRAP
jgi:tetratricopeptide (TPR) repeat protein